MAKVATSGATRSATSAALPAPAAAPTASVAAAAHSSGQPRCHSTPKLTLASARIEPTDRSIPPVSTMAVITAASAPISPHGRHMSSTAAGRVTCEATSANAAINSKLGKK